jgi:hypothetical protein
MAKGRQRRIYTAQFPAARQSSLILPVPQRQATITRFLVRSGWLWVGSSRFVSIFTCDFARSVWTETAEHFTHERSVGAPFSAAHFPDTASGQFLLPAAARPLPSRLLLKTCDLNHPLAIPEGSIGPSSCALKHKLAVTASLCFLPARAGATTTATEFLPDLAKGGAAFRKIGVIGTRQERPEMFSRDADTPGMQLVGGLYHLYPCSVSPCDCLNLPVIREAPSNSAAKIGAQLHKFLLSDN